MDEDLLKKNHDLAINAYISRVDNSPCGNTSIKLYKGADSRDLQQMRSKMLDFLKGSLKSKEKLQIEDPKLYAYFHQIWGIRERHMVMVSNLPSYIFCLLCCYQKDCPHPMCQSGRPDELPRWYEGGPFLTLLPLPVPDPERPLVILLVLHADFCAGHYKKNFLSDVLDTKAIKLVAKPPSIALKMFSSDVLVTESFMKNTAQKVLLPCHEVQMWLEHLKVIIENRKRGAAKAAATHRAKRAAQFIPLPATQSTPTQSLPSVATQCVPSSTGPSSATEWFC